MGADERVLWQGKPLKMPFILPGLATIPFGLIFMVFSVFWMFGASQAGGPFWLFGLVFFFAALVLCFGGTARQVLAYRNTEYVITNRRVIARTGAIGVDTRFVSLDKIQEIYVQVGFADKLFGTGTLNVNTAGFVVLDRGRSFSRPSLVALKDPYDVQKLLQEAIEAKRKEGN